MSCGGSGFGTAMNSAPPMIFGRPSAACAASHSAHDFAPTCSARSCCTRTSPSTVRRPSGQRERRDGFLFCRSRQRPSNQSQMMSTRRRYSAASGASTRTQAWSDLLPESMTADTGSPLARIAACCCSFGIGVPPSSRSNSTSACRKDVTCSFFAPFFAIGLMRTNSPSVVLKHFSMPPRATTRCFPFLAGHGDAARGHDLSGLVFPRRSDGDEFLGGEARVEQLGEPVRDGRRQRHRRQRSRITLRLRLAARRRAAGRWRGQWPVADRFTSRVRER